MTKFQRPIWGGRVGFRSATTTTTTKRPEDDWVGFCFPIPRKII
jgi:hypothetical protein